MDALKLGHPRFSFNQGIECVVKSAKMINSGFVDDERKKFEKCVDNIYW